MKINTAVSQDDHVTMLKTIDKLIICKMIEDYTKRPVSSNIRIFHQYNEFVGYFYDDLWEALMEFIEETGIGEADMENDTLRINLYSYERIQDLGLDEIDEKLELLFKELQSLKCTSWEDHGFLYLHLEDYDFENHLIAKELLKFDNYCSEIGEKRK
ncbi:hypothetical protein [Solibacillus isronensis]|uniref:hypothetical protein n=1 Tax=Solibacillus isronensis TaxID=412383 RepID=UPI0009A6F646|nr:hypothetical protein [Solibacillus isronensis]